ncbi:Diphosphoinositol polyphosphate phosphohydrolase 1 [Liparis tanakae]|uniref:Diphosphoinositol polyphosphate phosphohydrolase 1 n=1 Tax=Liparis tanakae TaxID=230148 RepID=A0A4Z2IJK6_9TELE|nr:Diphosphoinositol polyphosphate phosphohydrolase 1 [Liparis tanakae]
MRFTHVKEGIVGGEEEWEVIWREGVVQGGELRASTSQHCFRIVSKRNPGTCRRCVEATNAPITASAVRGKVVLKVSGPNFKRLWCDRSCFPSRQSNSLHLPLITSLVPHYLHLVLTPVSPAHPLRARQRGEAEEIALRPRPLTQKVVDMMKLKSNQTRTYDGDGYKKRAACLCFRSEVEEEVLLVSSSRHPDKWIVPGGGMEPEEEPNIAAARESGGAAPKTKKQHRITGDVHHNECEKATRAASLGLDVARGRRLNTVKLEAL